MSDRNNERPDGQNGLPPQPLNGNLKARNETTRMRTVMLHLLEKERDDLERARMLVVLLINELASERDATVEGDIPQGSLLTYNIEIKANVNAMRWILGTADVNPVTGEKENRNLKGFKAIAKIMSARTGRTINLTATDVDGGTREKAPDLTRDDLRAPWDRDGAQSLFDRVFTELFDGACIVNVADAGTGSAKVEVIVSESIPLRIVTLANDMNYLVKQIGIFFKRHLGLVIKRDEGLFLQAGGQPVGEHMAGHSAGSVVPAQGDWDPKNWNK